MPTTFNYTVSCVSAAFYDFQLQNTGFNPDIYLDGIKNIDTNYTSDGYWIGSGSNRSFSDTDPGWSGTYFGLIIYNNGSAWESVSCSCQHFRGGSPLGTYYGGLGISAGASSILYFTLDYTFSPGDMLDINVYE